MMAKKVSSKTLTKPKAKKATPAKTRPATAKTASAPTKSATSTLEETLRQLKGLGDAKVRAQNAKGGPWGSGAGDNQFGVKRGDLRKLADKLKTNHELALSLWKTGNIDAQFLATLVIDVK